jgi:hypothetical protein
MTPMGRPPLMIDATKFTLKAAAETLRRVDEWAARQDPPIRDRGAAIRAMIERVLREDEGR